MHEKIVRVRRELLGGSGSVLNAGFPEEGDDEHTVCYAELEEEEPEGSAFSKEIWLSGTGRSPWGEFVVRGRVRAWDGMILMTKSYKVRFCLALRSVALLRVLTECND